MVECAHLRNRACVKKAGWRRRRLVCRWVANIPRPKVEVDNTKTKNYDDGEIKETVGISWKQSQAQRNALKITEKEDRRETCVVGCRVPTCRGPLCVAGGM